METGPGGGTATEHSLPQTQFADLAARLEPVAARYLQQGAETLMLDAADLARRKPALFCAGAALAGFAAVRLLKAGTPRAAVPQPARRAQEEI